MHVRSDDEDAVHTPTFAARYFDAPVPKNRVPESGMPAKAAYQLVHEELYLDGNPALNLASFVTSWMEPEADKLAVESLNKNLVDQDEYPQTEEIHRRVVNMIARLFNAPSDLTPVGTATIGSSEAIMLGMLAHKRAWQKRGQGTGRPNLIVGADVHTCWEKFCNYFEVEARIVPMTTDRFTLRADEVRALIDENTIGVGAILGSTFTGGMDDIEGINKLLLEVERDRGWDIPIHVDAASGGFISPFHEPKLKWDFRLEKVRSINVSNHKFGLVYPGMGTVVFRDENDVPEELVFHINYLGGNMPNYSLNFSRPSNTVVLQYFNFLRLGFDGYERIVSNVMDTAAHLADGLAGSEHFVRVGDQPHFPVLAVRAVDPERLDVFALSKRLRERGWIVPAYTLPENAEHISVLRAVVKENFSRDMAELLISDVGDVAAELSGRKPPPREGQPSRPIC